MQAQDDLNKHIWRMFKGTLLLDAAYITICPYVDPFMIEKGQLNSL